MMLQVYPSPASFTIEQAVSDIYVNEAVVFNIISGEGGTQYWWDVEDGTINYTNNMDIEVVWADTGRYVVSAIGESNNGCFGDTVLHEAIVSDRDDGIYDYGTDELIRIYPNPAKEKVKVDYPDQIQLELFDILGHKILISEKKEIDISAYEKGTYLLKIKNEENEIICIRKLIIQ